MPKYYKWIVIETYPNGEIWTHYYIDRQNADWGVADLMAAHKGRTYTIQETAN